MYGSDVSLNLHIKLKHNGGNKTEREKVAVIHQKFKEKKIHILEFWSFLSINIANNQLITHFCLL